MLAIKAMLMGLTMNISNEKAANVAVARQDRIVASTQCEQDLDWFICTDGSITTLAHADVPGKLEAIIDIEDGKVTWMSENVEYTSPGVWEWGSVGDGWDDGFVLVADEEDQSVITDVTLW